jgi:GT2 family glycosyltransferase
VIVPTWKRTADLTRCLRALAAQTRRIDEVIVVTREDDEASREAARAVAMPEGTQYVLPRLRAPGAWSRRCTRGSMQARGSVIVLTDDDAEARPDWIARLVATLRSDRDIGGVGGRDWQPHERGEAATVGVVQWFGRVVGAHHLGRGRRATWTCSRA